MTPRERFLATARFEPADRAFLLQPWVWRETLTRWQAEGLPADADLASYFGTDREACVGRKCTEPLQSPVAFVSIWAKHCSPAPTFTSAGDRLQGAHFIKADNLPPSRPMAVDANYSVFFTSNSGSVLLHHV